MAYWNYLFNIIKSAWNVLSINALILEQNHLIYNLVLDLDLDSEDEDQEEQKKLDKEGKRAIDKNIERSKCDGCDQTRKNNLEMSYRRDY